MRQKIESEPKLKMSRGMKIVAAIFIPVWLVLVATIVSVAYHFIAKFW